MRAAPVYDGKGIANIELGSSHPFSFFTPTINRFGGFYPTLSFFVPDLELAPRVISHTDDSARPAVIAVHVQRRPIRLVALD